MLLFARVEPTVYKVAIFMSVILTSQGKYEEVEVEEESPLVTLENTTYIRPMNSKCTNT